VSVHLGSALNAFVDGELDAQRESEVLAHLAWCRECSSEADALQRFKAALREADPCLPMDLSARLMAVSSFPTAVHPARRPTRVRRQLDSRVGRLAVSGAFVVLGIGGAISLAGPAPRQPVAPVDPTNAGFVVDHTKTANEVPLTTVDIIPVAHPVASSPAP
jgi:anti-sigma factor RsiW